MVRFGKKRIVSVCLFSASAALVIVAVPALRAALLTAARFPLAAVSFIGREVGAAVFFHRNYVENRRLAREAGLLRSQLLQQEELRQENERLKQLLGFKSAAQLRLLPARAIGRSADTWAAALIIDKGSRAGVKPGCAVVTYAGFLGRVSDVSAVTSRVTLVTDPNIGVSGMNQRSREEGLVSGTLGNYLIMRYLPEQADVQAGDTIMTSGMNQVYPKGLLLGTVVSTSKDASGLSMHAILKPAVNVGGVEEVMVVLQ